MKGIKECINWMIDNEGKSIMNGAEEQTRYHNWKFEFKTKVGKWVELYNFHIFAAINWEPARELVDVKEAMKAHYIDKAKIKCVVWESIFIYNGKKDGCLVDQNGGTVTSKELVNGTWYILD